MIETQMASLGDLLRLERRPVKTVPDAEYAEIGIYSYGRGIFHKTPRSGLEVGGKDLFLVQENDFIFQITFAWEGAVALATQSEHGMYCSVRFPTFRVDESKCSPRYLLNYFRTRQGREQLIQISPGSAGRNRVLNLKRLSDITIPLPPLDEQRRIVARIEALAARIAEARGLRREAVVEAHSLANVAARKVLAEIDEQRSPLVKWLDDGRDGIQTGPFGAQLSTSDFTATGVPILTIGNVQFDGLNTTNLKHVSVSKAAELSRFTIRVGDLLFARMGTVGRCCIVPETADGWLINYHIIRVAIDKNRVEPRYIHWTIRASEDVEQYLEDKTRGATRPGVNSEILSNLPCRIPPIAIQQRIVAYLDGMQDTISTLNRQQLNTSEELDALLPSVLNRALRGEL